MPRWLKRAYGAFDRLPLRLDASDEQKLAAQQEAQDKLFAIPGDGEPTAGGFLLTKWEKGAFLEEAANPDFLLTGVTG